MTDPRFIHLRFHSEYSITDGIVRVDPMIHAVEKSGGVAIGICDLMNIFGGLRWNFIRRHWRPASSRFSDAT